MRRLGIPPRLLDQLAEKDETFTFGGRVVFTTAVGDLDRDGSRDVLVTVADYKITFDTGPAPFFLLETFDVKSHTAIDAVSGATGRTLWRKSFPDFVSPVPARVGSRARDGVIAIHGALSLLGPVEEHRLMIDALDGDTGKRIWRRTYESRWLIAPPVYATLETPISVEVFNGVPGGATDVLLGVGQFAAADYGGFLLTSTAIAVDGRDGREIEHPAIDAAANWYAVPWALGDLDGDGKDDYVVTNTAGKGDEPFNVVEARSGIDGSTLWVSGGFDFNEVAWPNQMPDVTGDRTRDLVISTLRDSWAWSSYLVSGEDGAARWRRPGLWPYSPGNVDGKGARDVVLRNLGIRFNSGTIISRAWSFDAKGHRLWESTIRSRYPTVECPRSCSGSAASGLWEIGDLQPDGLEDMFVRHEIEQRPGPEATFAYTIDARNGGRLLGGGEHFYALGGAVDAHGTDIATIRIEGSRIEVVARRGDTGAAQWETTVQLSRPLREKRTFTWAEARRLDRDGCAEVLVTLTGPKKMALVIALDGGDGAVSWTKDVGALNVVGASRGADRNPAC